MLKSHPRCLNRKIEVNNVVHLLNVEAEVILKITLRTQLYKFKKISRDFVIILKKLLKQG